ncbi:hypothetical protein Anas_07981 [Armadillidium nasatum]|uniref:Uncharacterized protein n=1 Tax=Armadillidium nasatum TaxID=96803 RepID=A0A5N5T041_9CRUS|nr:hypothetical protein Anas_07981 [Armadillidium nasatum]
MSSYLFWDITTLPLQGTKYFIVNDREGYQNENMFGYFVQSLMVLLQDLWWFYTVYNGPTERSLLILYNLYCSKTHGCFEMYYKEHRYFEFAIRKSICVTVYNIYFFVYSSK